MRWYACPDITDQLLGLAPTVVHRLEPRLASWNKADDPEQVRLRAYLDDTEAQLAGSRVDGPWALRLDVGLSAERDLLDGADLDNYAYPLAYRLRDSRMVSVWCTKQQYAGSYLQIEAAREVPQPSTEVLVVKTTASASTVAYKEQIYAAVAGADELPAGPVKLELSFIVGPSRNWLNLWKQTIDSLDPILGRTYSDRPWNPRDGRIIELGMHVTVDAAARNGVVVGIAATPASLGVEHTRYLLRTSARTNGWQVFLDDGQHPKDTYLLPKDGKKVTVYWAASGGVLMADTRCTIDLGETDADETGMIWRGDDPSTRAERVLSVLEGRTGGFPLTHEKDRNHFAPHRVCGRCFMDHEGACG